MGFEMRPVRGANSSIEPFRVVAEGLTRATFPLTFQLNRGAMANSSNGNRSQGSSPARVMSPIERGGGGPTVPRKAALLSVGRTRVSQPSLLS